MLFPLTSTDGSLKIWVLPGPETTSGASTVALCSHNLCRPSRLVSSSLTSVLLTWGTWNCAASEEVSGGQTCIPLPPSSFISPCCVFHTHLSFFSAADNPQDYYYFFPPCFHLGPPLVLVSAVGPKLLSGLWYIYLVFVGLRVLSVCGLSLLSICLHSLVHLPLPQTQHPSYDQLICVCVSSSMNSAEPSSWIILLTPTPVCIDPCVTHAGVTFTFMYRL